MASIARAAGIGWLVVSIAGAVGCGSGTSESTSSGSPTTTGGMSSSSGGGGEGAGGAATSSSSSSGGGTSSSSGETTGTGGASTTGTGGGSSTGGGASATGTGGESSAGGGGAGGATTGVGGGTGGSGGCSSDAQCDDQVFCNGAEICANGACVGGDPPSCDDGIGCTLDSCDEAAKACKHATQDALCDNKIACDGSEFCNALMGCLSTGAPSCDDAVDCTDDFCDLAADACAHVPNDNQCSDGSFCNGVEVCDPMNGAAGTGCKPGAPIVCNDNIPCTIDSCDEGTKACAFAPDHAACSDNVYCNGAEVCNPASGCEPGPAIVCNDNRSCTTDTCSEAQKKCVYAPNDAVCDDGLFCNGQETCDPAAPGPTGCKPGAPIACPSDNVACTVDACDEVADACKSVADNNKCPPGQFCIAQQGGCKAAQPCSTNAQCQDGDACNGMEMCVNGACAPGAPVDCDDGILCTVDSCNPQTGACAHMANNNACNDGFACTGVETCDPQVGCVSTPPVNCDDGVMCTLDQCQEPGGTCVHLAQNNLCSDGNLCNGIETCSPTGCKPAPGPFVCPDDGIACTTSVCDPVLNACKNVPDNSLCGCGQTCDPLQGCGKFCSVKTCQGKTYQCGDCLDNDGDCKVDDADDQCLGPCDNTEDSFFGGIPGQNNSPCKSDCYFDADTGSGNDDCYWSHKCDPYEKAPNYAPEDSQCAYNPNANISGYAGTCQTAMASQSATCKSYCGPLTPNGCDCFGCCNIPGAPTPVWLGSENGGVGSCTINSLNDPTKCKPCTQVTACLNTCDTCEICVGKPQLPPGCQSQTCPMGAQPCGLPGQPFCPDNSTCITGCCQLNP